MLCTDFFCDFWVIPPTRIGIGSERGQVTASAGKEGGEILHLSPSQKAKVCRQFERFCKDVLECESIDYIRHITARAEHVITFSDLPEPVLEQLHTTDTYPSDMYLFDVYLFDVCGFHLPIHDDRLGQALLEIGVEGYSILLLSFLLDLSDRQIALLLNSSKSSIQRRRTAFFETLKSKMKE